MPGPEHHMGVALSDPHPNRDIQTFSRARQYVFARAALDDPCDMESAARLGSGAETNSARVLVGERVGLMNVGERVARRPPVSRAGASDRSMHSKCRSVRKIRRSRVS